MRPSEVKKVLRSQQTESSRRYPSEETDGLCDLYGASVASSEVITVYMKYGSILNISHLISIDVMIEICS